MPAAAVIPAPIAYIKVVAVKKLVVGFLREFQSPVTRALRSSIILLLTFLGIHLLVTGSDTLP